MSDTVVRFVSGNFAPPNEDNINKVTSNQDTLSRNANLGSSVLLTAITQQAKGIATAGLSRVGEATGNRTLGRQIQETTEIVGNLITIGQGFATGGLVGGGIAVAAVGIQYAQKAYDIDFQNKRANIVAAENRRRSGLNSVDKRGGFR